MRANRSGRDCMRIIAADLDYRSWRRRRRAVRRAAAKDGPAATDVLVAACADEHPKVRVAAARAVRHVHSEGHARQLLVGLLADPEFEVRFEAAITLAPTRDARALSVLVSALDAPDPQLRSDTASALASLTDQERDWIELVLATLAAKRVD